MNSSIAWALGLAAAILVAAVASALANLYVEPLLKKFGKVIFAIITLGLKSLSDEFYRDVARGYRETASTFLLLFLVMALSFPLGITIRTAYGPNPKPVEETILLKKVKMIIQQQTQLSQEEAKELQDQVDKEIHALHEEIEAAERGLAKVGGLLIFLVFAILLFQYSKTSYKNFLIGVFHQGYNQCLPYMNDAEAKQMLAAFASMRSRDHFTAILDRLSKIAHDHDRHLGHFSLP